MNIVKFKQSGSYHAGEYKSLDLAKISRFEICRQRNTCELIATTPENPQPHNPYMIARRDREYEIAAILADLQQLKKGTTDTTYEITDTEARLIP